MHPFELSSDELTKRLDEMVAVTFEDLQSQFLILPKGAHFVDFTDFQDAYETLKRHTNAFSDVDSDHLNAALAADGLSFVVLRTILGLSPPEWAELARQEKNSDIDQNGARKLDVDVRHDRELFARLTRNRHSKRAERVGALLAVAAELLQRGTIAGVKGTIHRMDRADTCQGLASLRHLALNHVPYAMLLYERYLGRPFASHRDSVSEMVGNVMESAVEDLLAGSCISYRKSGRAERIPGFEQAPDFFIPSEFAPAVLIEAKITNDDGTARDKVDRIKVLAQMRDRWIREGRPGFELVACIDGRGFGIRRQDMRDTLSATGGKVFTLATLPRLLESTRLREYLGVGTRPG
jgi:hypothetical protein